MADSRWFDVLVALLPGLALALVFVALLGIYAASDAPRRAPTRRSGSALLPEIFIGFWYWLATPVVDRLAGVGVRPNHITLFSLGVAALAALALAAGRFMVGSWLLVAAASCDLLDGLLARRTGTGSQAGAFLDSFADRIAEGMVFAGLAFYGGGGWLTWSSLWAMLASVMVSYARARGEALGADCKAGLMQRPERLLWLIFILFAAPLAAIFLEPGADRPVFHVAVGGIALLALLSSVTAVRRAVWIVRALDDKPERPAPTEPSGDYTRLESSAPAAP